MRMKHFTLLLAAATLAITPALAQTETMTQDGKFAPLRSFKKATVLFSAKTTGFRAPLLRSAKQSATPVWKVSHDKQYTYDDTEGTWEFAADDYYTYDANGNVTVQIQDDGSEKVKAETVYDAAGNAIGQVTSISEDGDNYTPYNKKTSTYDGNTGTVTGYESWTLDGDTWTMGYGCYKIAITRNADGNVTKVTKTEYDNDSQEWTKTDEVTYTYTAGSTGPTGCTYSGIDEDTNEYGVIDVFTNMVWEKCDGQLVDEQSLPATWFWGSNLLKSATLVESGVTLNVEGKNDENGFVMSMTSPSNTLYLQTMEMKVNDENGSYTFGNYLYASHSGDVSKGDTDLIGCAYETITYDEKGNITLDEAYTSDLDYMQWNPAVELVQGMKNEYTYSDNYGGEISETTTSYYDTDTEAYIPTVKVSAIEYIDLATAISDIKTDTDTSVKVYNAQGVAVGTSTDGLPRGLYIVKQGGKTFKTIRK